jgi:hypothetical protein
VHEVGSDRGSDDPTQSYRQSNARIDFASHRKTRRSGECDEDDCGERVGVCPVLVKGKQTGEQRHHDDAPTDSEDTTEQACHCTDGEKGPQTGIGSGSSPGHVTIDEGAWRGDRTGPIGNVPELTTRNVIVGPGGLVTCRR